MCKKFKHESKPNEKQNINEANNTIPQDRFVPDAANNTLSQDRFITDALRTNTRNNENPHLCQFI